MKLDACCYAAGGLALLLAACGAGDHSRSAELNRFFGGGAAGTTGSGRGTDDSVPEPDMPTPASTPRSTGNAGAKATAPQTPSTVGRPPSAGSAGRSTSDTSAGGVSAASPAAGSGGAAAGSGGPTASPAAPPTSSGPDAMPPRGGSGSATSCPSGYLAAGSECVCDMNGSFALQATIPVTFDGMAPIEPLDSSVEVMGLLRQQYDASGNLKLSMSICGQTTPDICANAQPPLLSSPEAYGQYVPVESWDRASETPATAELSLPAPLPGSAIDTPALAQLLGISLSDPLGAWPASYKDVQGTNAFDGSATNGAQWVDADGDGKSGATQRVVSASGAMSSATSGPLVTYGGKSAECPRSNAGAARSPYAYLPLPQGLGVKRVKALYVAQRVSFELHGKLDSCDQASGMLTGANGSALRFDLLIAGCSMVNGSGETDCTQGVIDTASKNGGGAALKLDNGNFTWTRMAADATCADVRAARTANVRLTPAR